MIVVVDSGVANISSVIFALDRLGASPVLSDDPKIIKSADKVILPGVGAAKTAMKNLADKNLVKTLQSLENPVLGICLGMQIMFDTSKEGDTNCLSIINGDIAHIPSKQGYTIPHMGWNSLNIKDSSSPLLQEIKDGDYVYFVHSYYAPLSNNTIASTDYIVPITAIVNKGNFYGCQFHPEKSGEVGSKILKNFLEL